MGHQINQDGIRPPQDKLEAITKINIPLNEKELKSFLGAIQYLSKYIKNLSAQTDILRKLLKKQNEWIWTEEHTEAFNNLKKLINPLPCLAHYNSNKENILTTDASTKGLGATLWQKQKDGNLKPVGFASRFLSDNEKKYAIFTVTGGEFTGYYRFVKGFYGLADIPTIFQERIDRTLEFKHPAWLDDIIIVTKGTIEKHKSEVKETMKKIRRSRI